MTLIPSKVCLNLVIIQSLTVVIFTEYTDDTQLIPRSSSVIAKRLPASRPGKGKAALYIAGSVPAAHSGEMPQTGKPAGTAWTRPTGPMSKRFDRPEAMKSEIRARSAVGLSSFLF